MSHFSKIKEVKFRDRDILIAALERKWWEVKALDDPQSNSLTVRGVGSSASGNLKATILEARKSGQDLEVGFVYNPATPLDDRPFYSITADFWRCDYTPESLQAEILQAYVGEAAIMQYGAQGFHMVSDFTADGDRVIEFQKVGF